MYSQRLFKEHKYKKQHRYNVIIFSFKHMQKTIDGCNGLKFRLYQKSIVAGQNKYCM